MFQWTPKHVCELIEIARKSPNRTVASATYAARYGLDEDKVKKFLYRLTSNDPELDRELPKGYSGPAWSDEMSCELIETIKASENRMAGCRTFAAKHGISASAASARLNRIIDNNPELDHQLPKGESPIKKKRPSVDQALADTLAANFGPPLKEEDIHAAADKAGVSYATALGTYGSMMSKMGGSPLVTGEPEDGSREISRIQEIVGNLKTRLRRAEDELEKDTERFVAMQESHRNQLQAQDRSFRINERMYLSKIDTLSNAREIDRQELRKTQDRNSVLESEKSSIAKLLAEAEKLAGDRGVELEKLKLERISLEELIQAKLTVPDDLRQVIANVAKRASVSEKAAEKAVADVICDSVIYSAMTDRIAKATDVYRMNLLKKISAVEASTPYEELRRLHKEIKGLRALNRSMIDRLARKAI